MDVSAEDQILDAFVRQVAPKVPFLVCGISGIHISRAMVYYTAGQAKGVLGSTIGAAQYEALTHMPGPGTIVIGAMSFSHLYVVGIVLFANLMYYRKKIVSKIKKDE